MKTMSMAEWLAEGERRFGPDKRKWKFVCPMCGTAQSAEDFYAAGFKPGVGEVNKYLGFSCIGRFTGQGDQGILAKVRGETWTKGCNWTLGGLVRVHDLEIVDDDGHRHMHFDFAEAPAIKPQQEVTKAAEVTA